MNRRSLGLYIAPGILLLLLSSTAAVAAPVQQSFTLKPGWNAVFLEVEPANPDPAVVFAGVTGLQSVWAWNRRTSPAEFTKNPAMPLPQDPNMLSWFPGEPAPGQPDLDNLYRIYGERGYLIHRDAAAGEQSWSVTGEPTVPAIDWKPDSFNFVGFHLKPGSGPTFSHFFAASPAHAGQEIYVLDNATGSWRSAGDVPMTSGEAFWVYCKGDSEFVGTLGVQVDRVGGLAYGTRLVDQKVRLENRSSDDASVDIRLSPPDPSLPPPSLPAPDLRYLKFDPAAAVSSYWLKLPWESSLGAGTSQEITLGVQRAGIPADETRTANVAFSDDHMRILVPASVTGTSYAGLWVGDVTLRKVSQPGLPPQEHPDSPTETGSELSFRIIVHRDTTGNARLLREVAQLWQESARSYVLVANEARLGEFTPAAMRDGQPVGRRISTAAFGFNGHRDMAGSFSLPGRLDVTVDIPWDDPVNPFLHRYHPDHKTIEQSFKVIRVVTLEFTDQLAGGAPVPGATALSWGSSEVGGIYTEVLNLERGDSPADTADPKYDDPYHIHAEGTFLLRKVSSIGQLEL